MDTHEVVSCVRGYHIYGNIWTPSVGDLLSCERESGNLNDLYAVALKNGRASMDCNTLVTFLLAASTSFVESNEVLVLLYSLSLSLINFNNAILHELIQK